jgi:hypothetical protein
MGEKELAGVMEPWGLGRGQVIWEVEEKKTGEGEAFYRVTRRRSTSQGGKTSSLHDLRVKSLISPSRVCMCVWSRKVPFSASPGSQNWAPAHHRLKLTKQT